MSPETISKLRAEAAGKPRGVAVLVEAEDLLRILDEREALLLGGKAVYLVLGGRPIGRMDITFGDLDDIRPLRTAIRQADEP